MNMYSVEKGLEDLFNCRLNQQTTKLNELFTKHSQMTKADLDEIKASQEFLGSKFDELAALINEVTRRECATTAACWFSRRDNLHI